MNGLVRFNGYNEENFSDRYTLTKVICPVCGSDDIDEDCWTCDDGDDFMERKCNKCGFSTGGDYQSMIEYWDNGVSNLQ